jgi:hypothetical protein
MEVTQSGKKLVIPHEIILCLQGSFLNDKRIICVPDLEAGFAMSS